MTLNQVYSLSPHKISDQCQFCHDMHRFAKARRSFLFFVDIKGFFAVLGRCNPKSVPRKGEYLHHCFNIRAVIRTILLDNLFYNPNVFKEFFFPNGNFDAYFRQSLVYYTFYFMHSKVAEPQ